MVYGTFLKFKNFPNIFQIKIQMFLNVKIDKIKILKFFPYKFVTHKIVLFYKKRALNKILQIQFKFELNTSHIAFRCS